MKSRILIILFAFPLFFSCIDRNNTDEKENLIDVTKLKDKKQSILQNKSVGIAIDMSIWANETVNNERKFVRSFGWTSYIITDSVRLMPDTIFILNKIWYPPMNLLFNKKESKQLKHNITIQLKFSKSIDCRFPENPTLSKEYNVLKDEMINEWNISESTKKNKYFEIYSNPILLKNIMFENNIDIPNDTIHNKFSGQCLNQIIVRSYFQSEDKKIDCFYEYIQPICTGIPSSYSKSY